MTHITEHFKKHYVFAVAALICTAVLLTLTSCKSNFTANEYSYETRGGNLFITSYTPKSNIDGIEYTVPNKIDGKKVYGVASGAYKNCTFASLTVPEGIVVLEDNAFSGCSELTSVTISSTVEDIAGAFKLCNSIGEMTIKSDRFTDIDGIIYTKDGKTIVLALAGAVKPNSALTIPDSVEKIGAYAFNRAEMSSLSLPAGLIDIGEQAFYSCRSLTSLEINSPNLMIGTFAFGYCTELTALKINDIFSIGEDAFRRCGKLKTIEAENVDYIGTGAFRMCGELETVNISGSYNYIPSDMFSGCSMLDDCILDGDFKSDRVNMMDGNEINTINNSAFSGCSSLPAPIIPDGIVKLGPYAFNQCEFKSIYVPDGITYIAEMAFYECMSANSVRLPSTLEYIGFQGFAYNEALTSITVPKSVKELGVMAFYSCSKLSSITLEEGGCETMGVLCFGNCISVSRLRLPQSFKNVKIKDETFFNTDIKEDLTYDFTVQSNGKKYTVYEVYKYSYGYEFVLDNDIEYMLLDNSEDIFTVSSRDDGVEITGVKSEYAGYLDGHSTLVIPDEIGGKAVVSIAKDALSKFNSVVKLTLPEKLVSIADGAFSGMLALRNIIFTGSKPELLSISSSAASNTTLLTYYVPSNAYEGYTELLYGVFGDDVSIEVNPDSLFVFAEYSDGYRVVSLIDAAAQLNIKSLTIPGKYNGKDVLAISKNALSMATAAEDIYIPASVTRIYDGAFSGCSSLKFIHLISNADKIVIGSGLLDGTEGVKICVPAEFYPNYHASYDWEGYTLKSE